MIKEKNKMQKILQQKGITLVALVITIIIVLILAGISIQALTNTGLFARAQQAKEETEIANIKEQIQLDIYKNQLTNTGNLTDQDLKEILEKYGTINYEEDKKTIKSITTKDNYEIAISDIWSGSIQKVILANGSWNNLKGVNSPQLMQGMTGVYWDENGNEVTVTVENQGNWYDYNSQKWANAKTKDGSYWVWIPRYAYQIETNCNNGGTDISGKINIKFLQGTTNYDSTGKEISTTYPAVVDNKMQDFVVHPAFETDLENGGWDKDLAGIWVAKYAAGFQECTQTVSSTGTITEPTTNVANVKYSDKPYTIYNSSYPTNALGQDLSSTNYASQKLSYPVFKPLTYAYNVISTGDSYTISQEIAKASSFYGLNSSKTDSHQMKNSEWGAVAYLTQSSCGRDKTEVTINSKNLGNLNSKFIYAVTGYEGSDTANGVGASSTGNKSGVFDLNGCVWERTAGYIENPNGASNRNAYGGELVAETNLKYKTIYPYNTTSDSYTNNYDEFKKLSTTRFGDGILETSTTGKGATSWHGDYSYFPYSGFPFFVRGGNYGNSSYAGAFAFSGIDGSPNSANGFRAVLVGV